MAQLLPSGQLLLPEYGDTTFTGTAVKYLAITDAGNVIEADAGDQAPTVSSPTVATTTTINFQSRSRGIFTINLDFVDQTALVPLNPVNGGEYTFWLKNASTDSVYFPDNFFDADSVLLEGREIVDPKLVRFFYDGTNYITDDTLGIGLGAFSGDTVLISNLVAWYVGDDIGIADEALVSSWVDASGNGNDLTQDTTARQPKYQTNFLNGHAVVDFVGVDEWMRTLTGSLVQDTINRTFFIVATSDDAGTSSSKFIFNDGSEETAGTGGQFGLTSELAIRVDGGSRIWTSNLVSGDGWEQITVMLGTSSTNGTSTSDISGWLNGSSMSVSSTSALTVDTDDTFFSLARKTADFPQAYNYFNGQIAEIIVYDRALTATERAKIEVYLANKYGAF
ncbi:MAG: hypothetical protein IPK76_27205 [Lewinellaceae bacterium]|nr:hypothetical protein [Lewinellaceae bacterium]